MSNEAKNSLKGAHHRITAAAYLVIGRVRHHDAPRSRLLTGTVRCRVLSRATIDAAAAARRCAAAAAGKAELQAASGRRRGTSGSLGAPSCSAWECAAEVRRVPLSPMRARRERTGITDSAGPGRTFSQRVFSLRDVITSASLRTRRGDTLVSLCESRFPLPRALPAYCQLAACDAGLRRGDVGRAARKKWSATDARSSPSTNL